MKNTVQPIIATTARTATTEQLLEPKQERAARTRAHILKFAAELFSEQGYQRTSIADVAKRVGMTKGAVYFHFKDKDDIAIAVVEAHYQRWPMLLDKVKALELDPLATLCELLDRMARAFRDEIVVQAGSRLQAERSLINTSLPQPYQDWIDRLTPLLAEAQEAGQVRTDMKAEALARVLVSSFFGMQHISDILHGRADLAERWAEVRTVVLGALSPR